MVNELLTYLAKSLVDYPEKVHIEEVADEKIVNLKLIVHSSDLGKIIGKQGRIIKAIRTLINAASAKENKKFNVEIVE